MSEVGRYDSSLQMFIEAPGPIDQRKIRFLRWLNEQGLTGDTPPLGPPSGPLAESLADEAEVAP